MRKQILALLGGAVMAICGIGTSSAADLPVKSARPAAPAFSWTGCYIHGNVGVGIFGRNFVDYGESVSYGSQYTSDWGFSGGAGLGCNWQAGSFVYGVEGDWNWTSFSKDFYSREWDTTFKSKWDWYATLRTRFGLAIDRTLVYATAGVAFAQTDYKLFYSGETQCTGAYDGYCRNKVDTGLVAGVGIEYALTNNWSMKAEYLGLYFPTKWATSSSGLGFEYSFSSYAHVVRYGLTYRFGAGGVGFAY